MKISGVLSRCDCIVLLPNFRHLSLAALWFLSPPSNEIAELYVIPLCYSSKCLQEERQGVCRACCMLDSQHTVWSDGKQRGHWKCSQACLPTHLLMPPRPPCTPKGPQQSSHPACALLGRPSDVGTLEASLWEGSSRVRGWCCVWAGAGHIRVRLSTRAHALYMYAGPFTCPCTWAVSCPPRVDSGLLCSVARGDVSLGKEMGFLWALGKAVLTRKGWRPLIDLWFLQQASFLLSLGH